MTHAPLSQTTRVPDACDYELSPDDGAPSQAMLVRLAPLLAIMALGFLTVSLPLPALPLHVHDTLGFNAAVAGLVVGIQSLATVLTRIPAGRLVDRRGPKAAVVSGLLTCSAAGWFYLASSLAAIGPLPSLIVLIAGRLALGIGESLMITGVLSWALVRAGPGRAGAAMSWNGMAQYGALALGAPCGFALYRYAGFAALALVTALVPLCALLAAGPLRAVMPKSAARASVADVLGQVWRPGIGLMLGGIGFAAVSAFASLDFAAKHWSGAGFALFAYGAGFVIVRIFAGGLPDRIGGGRVAAISLALEAVGQVLLWLAPVPVVALLGAGLTGTGCSLLFPAFGIEAFRRVPPQTRGLAVATFAAFQDVAIGLTGPGLGLVAAVAHPSLVFAVGAVAAGFGMSVALRLRSD